MTITELIQALAIARKNFDDANIARAAAQDAQDAASVALGSAQQDLDLAIAAQVAEINGVV